jgi:single-strand DNA-binding protein
MNHLNSIIYEGEIKGIPTLDETRNGNQVCNFLVESKRYFKRDDGLGVDVSLVPIEAWGKLGHNAFNQAKEGRSLRVVGRLKQTSWIGKIDNLHHERTCIVAEHIEFKPVFEKDKKPSERELFTEASKKVELEDLYEGEEVTCAEGVNA